MFSRSCLNAILATQEQTWRKKMTSVPSNQIERTSLSQQKRCKQRWRSSVVHIWHTCKLNRCSRMSGVDSVGPSKTMVDALEPLEKVVWITQTKNSFGRPGQRSYLAFSQLKKQHRFVFTMLSGHYHSRLYTISPSHNFKDNHTKIFVSRSILARFRQATWSSM